MKTLRKSGSSRLDLRSCSRSHAVEYDRSSTPPQRSPLYCNARRNLEHIWC
ncbi:hypothetical protein XOC_0452 [Xanthomonas oryzae pv. oryzicola BLS256]|uniref:Uncharacterized protein n=1 Tax=Xanthomonas oryzae pv. oryzicola (strain BLS256) TaxID=383407 RepID=G7T9M8_XANOB|nr:hypothetical protein XOC_0452 [Xanthomonas oryzae pv. oryzicola BLS256]QEO99495.1 hypothetical protein XOCgx_4508 [Xanthomonas oryzae pv. oryzicola]